jgi:hypothetical protein
MTPIRSIAVQAAITLTLTGLLGAALFIFADYATTGVIA